MCARGPMCACVRACMGARARARARVCVCVCMIMVARVFYHALHTNVYKFWYVLFVCLYTIAMYIIIWVFARCMFSFSYNVL